MSQTKGFSGIEKNFDTMDASKDGTVTIEEHHARERAIRATQKK